MGYRVVIGDDESIIRMDLCEMLEDAGHTVVGEAADGVEALDLVRKEKPDIVLLDIKMPRLDGIHAARMIGHEGLAPVLLLTAYSSAGYRRQGQGLRGPRLSGQTGQPGESLPGYRNRYFPVPPPARSGPAAR